jgi:hypothetical protein
VMDLEVKKRKEKYEEKFDRPFGFIWLTSVTVSIATMVGYLDLPFRAWCWLCISFNVVSRKLACKGFTNLHAGRSPQAAQAWSYGLSWSAVLHTTCTQKYSADRDFTYKVLMFEDQLLSHHTMKSSENYIILKKISWTMTY